MGMQVGNKGPRADINVTPLVDVVLVLLIIFMVIAPMLDKVIPIQVPEEAEHEPEPQEKPNDQVIVRLEADGSIFVNKTAVQFEELDQKLWDVFRSRGEKVVFFDGHKEANYESVVQILDAMKSAGIKTIGIVTVDLPPIPSGGEAPAP